MRALRAALLLLLATHLLECSAGKNDEAPDEADADDESDSAPFMIVVEGGGAGGGGEGGDEWWRCSGSLVSLRTGVTSAECALGRSRDAAMRELWALAAATAAGQASRQDGARRVSRLATAGQRQVGSGGGGAEWEDGLLELAVLELESPFGSGAHARPILMATAPHECADVGVCHVVRSLEAHGDVRAQLRIVDATLADDAPCAEQVRHWAALRERALCLTGPRLCRSERGAGVVCGGKLCGVVARSAGGGAGGAGGGAADQRQCGDTHAAQSVARWRRFLHCAHTLRACGRGSCAELCSERRLLDDSEEVTDTTPAQTERAVARTAYPPAEQREQEHERDQHDEREQHDGEHAAPHAHALQLDLAHLTPDTYTVQYANSTRVVPPTRVRPEEYAQQTAGTPAPAAPPPSPGVQPTRTPPAPPHAPTRAPSPPAPPPVVRAVEPQERPAPTVLRVAAPGPPAAPRRPPAGPPAAPRRLSTRRPPGTPSTPLPPLTELTSSSSVRPTPLFEPNRPDFRSGEYGDNAAEYGAPLDDGSTTTTTTNTTAAAPHTGLDAPRTSAPGRNVTAGVVAGGVASGVASGAAEGVTRAPPSVARRRQQQLASRSNALADSWRVTASTLLAPEMWPAPPRLCTEKARVRPRPTHTRPTHTRTAPHARDDVLYDGTSLDDTTRQQAPQYALPITPLIFHHTDPVTALPRLLFEPNRADFQMGEYGDNAAAYVESEDEGAPAAYHAGATVAPTAARAPHPARASHRNRSRHASSTTRRVPATRQPQPVQLQRATNKSAALTCHVGHFYSILIYLLYNSNR